MRQNRILSTYFNKKTWAYWIIFISFLLLYYLTSAGHTPYDYFTRLAKSLLEGRLYLTENPPWLSELIPWGQGKYFFVNPPMPAILSLPFVYLFGDKFHQELLAHLIGAGIVVVTFFISQKIKNDFKTNLWSGLFVGAGSIIWYLSSTGSVWFLGQITATLFILLAIHETLSKKRSGVVGLLLSFALLSRLQILPSLVFFIFTLKDKLKGRNLVKFLAGIAVFFVAYGFYNYLRFGKLWETGYTLIPEILQEPWFNKGQFSLFYIPKHLKIIFLGLPKFIGQIPYVEPSWAGLAIWITSPVFIYSIFAPLKIKQNIFTWVVIFLIAIINFSYGSTGYSQFGYRYAVDFYPFLILLTIKGVSKTGLKWHHWFLLTIGVLVNLWGVIFINKFGWVGF